MHRAYSTKAKRAACAKQLVTAAVAQGADYVIRHDGRSINVTLALKGVTAHVFLDGDSKAAGFLAHWVSDRPLCHSLAADLGGTVNPHHGCKATTFAHSFDALLHRIDRGMELINSGDAFAEPDTAQCHP